MSILLTILFILNLITSKDISHRDMKIRTLIKKVADPSLGCVVDADSFPSFQAGRRKHLSAERTKQNKSLNSSRNN